MHRFLASVGMSLDNNSIYECYSYKSETSPQHKGVVIIYDRGWGGASMKIVCTLNLPLSELARHVFAPPGTSAVKFTPPYPSVPIPLHVN